jgi:hypothetical protein
MKIIFDAVDNYTMTSIVASLIERMNKCQRSKSMFDLLDIDKPRQLPMRVDRQVCLYP